MKVLGPNDTGSGILIEWDAGYISPNDKRNSVLLESYGELDWSKPFEFYAVLQKYDTPNRNGRVYPEKILRREADKYKKAIEKGLSISELNHPESSLIDLDRVAHRISDIWWEGNMLMGKVVLLTSPGFHKHGIISCPADLAANLMRQGVTMGISSRGVGSLIKKGEQNEVQDDFELICFDLVSSPSTPGAYLFLSKDDRVKYDENLDLDNKKVDVSDKKNNKSLDLMKKLSDYLNY